MPVLISISNQLSDEDVMVTGTEAKQPKIVCDHGTVTCIDYQLPAASNTDIINKHIKITAGEKLWYLAVDSSGQVLKKDMDRNPVFWMNWPNKTDQGIEVFKWNDGTVDIRVAA